MTDNGATGCCVCTVWTDQKTIIENDDKNRDESPIMSSIKVSVKSLESTKKSITFRLHVSSGQRECVVGW